MKASGAVHLDQCYLFLCVWEAHAGRVQNQELSFQYMSFRHIANHLKSHCFQQLLRHIRHFSSITITVKPSDTNLDDLADCITSWDRSSSVERGTSCTYAIYPRTRVQR